MLELSQDHPHDYAEVQLGEEEGDDSSPLSHTLTTRRLTPTCSSGRAAAETTERRETSR